MNNFRVNPKKKSLHSMLLMNVRCGKLILIDQLLPNFPPSIFWFTSSKLFNALKQHEVRINRFVDLELKFLLKKLKHKRLTIVLPRQTFEGSSALIHMTSILGTMLRLAKRRKTFYPMATTGTKKCYTSCRNICPHIRSKLKPTSKE